MTGYVIVIELDNMVNVPVPFFIGIIPLSPSLAGGCFIVIGPVIFSIAMSSSVGCLPLPSMLEDGRDIVIEPSIFNVAVPSSSTLDDGRVTFIELHNMFHVVVLSVPSSPDVWRVTEPVIFNVAMSSWSVGVS